MASSFTPSTGYKTFTWKGITWEVKKLTDWVYRDAAHLGGPWSSVVNTLNNKSIDVSFRRALRRACGL